MISVEKNEDGQTVSITMAVDEADDLQAILYDLKQDPAFYELESHDHQLIEYLHDQLELS